ncbi:hypothetical protein PTSG_04192 [Salpingoeca rosetta]|uniref:RING-type domain-containing protein n=1 Tax=Salpingoeca rosetta (strain ATCC 50818 / BSB-021) TaxID=946362 RepID=F2U6V3_SALR5|nr:uncharacterized protein PTSG_04192 [Salpingoeca rosetta]EGD83585.1 hypothetical protein PTSG_04192 [Salpingoeca rosetta]|eukprot:XP_004995089.1 hypothetical protein PTSG_04192 [Salpingoeca rosetta]
MSNGESDWFLCNHCKKPYSNDAAFVLTKCAHIFCSACTAGRQQCLECGKPLSTLRIHREMTTGKEFFAQTWNHTQQVTSALAKATKVDAFRYQQMKLALKKLYRENQELQATLKRLKNTSKAAPASAKQLSNYHSQASTTARREQQQRQQQQQQQRPRYDQPQHQHLQQAHHHPINQQTPMQHNQQRHHYPQQHLQPRHVNPHGPGAAITPNRPPMDRPRSTYDRGPSPITPLSARRQAPGSSSARLAPPSVRLSIRKSPADAMGGPSPRRFGGHLPPAQHLGGTGTVAAATTTTRGGGVGGGGIGMLLGRHVGGGISSNFASMGIAPDGTPLHKKPHMIPHTGRFTTPAFSTSM